MGTKGNPHNNNAGSGSDSDSRWSGCSGPRERDRTRGPKRGPRKGASGAGASGARAARGPQRFAVTASGDTGLKLRIAALPRAPPRAPRAPQPPQPPHAAPAPLRRLRGRPRNEVGVAVGCASSSSSSSASASSSSSSSSSDSDSGGSAGGSANASSDDSSAALAAACSLQVIDDEDLAALLPEGGQPAAVVPVAAAAPFPPPFVAPSPQHLHDDKSIQDTGDGSSSEMEIPAQLVTAAIQRATADSSGSENEGCDRNAGGPSATHYASSLLRQFVAQTQLLNHSASMNQPVAAEPPEPPADEVADLRDCLLPPSDFLADEHLAAAAGRHLSPQQTEELRLINKDLAEIVSHANPADRTNFVNIDVSDPGSDFAKGDIKKSPAPSTEEAAPSRATAPPAARDGDCKRKRGRPRKTKEPPEVRGGAFPKEEKAAPAIEAIAADDFCLGADDPPNVSPDSGILSNHNSPARSPVGKRERKKEAAAAPARRRSASRRRRARSRSRPRDASPSSEASSSFGRKTAPPPPPALKVETPSPTPSRRQRVKKSDAKLDIAALDRMLYATDRVLYPPRRKAAEGTRGARGRALGGDSADSDGEMTANRSVLSEAYAKRKDLNKLAASTRKGGRDLDDWRDRRSDAEGPADDALDPTWRQIDLNPRFRDVLSGYRSDRDVKPHKSCSRLIESGYRSECGFRGGYRSDRGCRSGYKTDHRSGYRSDKSGYKSDRSVRSVRGGRKRMRKMKKSRSVRDRTYYKNQKYFVTDREILLLANKTFSCLTLGRGDSDSDSDSDYRSGRREVKFASACAKFRSLSVGADFGFGACGLFASASSERPSAVAPDPFAPGPVFGAFNARIPTSTINVNLFQSSNAKPLFSEPHEHMFGGSPALGRSPVFSHKFARSPMLADGKDDPDEATPKGGGDTPKRARSLRPEQKRGAKAADVVSVRRTDKSPVVVADAFRKARNSYVPSEALARNVFLNVRSPRRKSPASRDKKRRKRLGVGVGVVAGAIEPAPAATVGATTRPSRAPSVRDDRRRRHRGKRRRPSRSLSRPRDASVKRGADAVDPGFAEEVDGLSSRFAELCRVASEAPPPASADRAADAEAPAAASEAGAAPAPAAATPPATGAAPAAAAPTKSAKRASKKRKASDLADAPPPASKRRHKKQPAEGQSRGDEGDASANEHKLPLKKRHYHVNRSTAAGVASESADGLEADGARPADADADAFECTETDCRADGEGEAEADGGKRAPDAADALMHAADADASSSDSDVKLQIPKPTGETSELSKKIYETSERLKAAHRLIHDLEKSLPKTERADGDESKTESAGPGSSPLGSKSSSAPIVTPKKRHRLEADRAVSNSPLDQVVQSLTKKLSEDRGLSLEGDGSENKSDRCAPLKNQESDGKKSSQTDSAVANDPIKSLSTRNLHKTPTVCVQKSDIMTRKKIRLEGLTSNLVSKINPNGATKTLDILINNNLRKSIESRTGDRSKENLVELGHKSQEEKSKARKDNSGSTPRATVIKSPISRQKLPAEAKKLPKGTEILIEETVVVEVEKPTGIFEPSVDIEMQIPKSSISLSGTTELFGKNHRASLHLQKLDGKNHLKFAKENDIPPVLADGDLSPRKRSESIASLICDKIQESGHNLRQSKRSGFLDGDKKLEECPSEKKKKKPSNILRESKLSAICPQTPPPKILPEKMNPVVDIKKSDIENVALKCLENAASDAEKSVPLKKRVKRRKTINRTGFPSVKKKKKKISPTSSAIPSSRSEANVNSAFERVPEDGEATDRFLERTAKFKPAELKIVLKKEDYPKRSRLSVISLERLQGKRSSETEKREEPAPAEVSEDIDSDVELHLLGKTIAKRAPEETKPRAGARRAARKATPPSRETSLSSSESSSGSTCSRETSVDTLNNFRDRCEEPLPLNEKEEDVERSGDGLPKSGGRRRPASPRDDSPASSVDGFKTADKDRMKRNPRLRKKYLVAGLFSDYYKQNEPKPVDPKGRFNINLKDFPNGLLAPPPYCERWIRQRKRHFQLPYDVWWQRRYNQSVPSWNYRKIRTNVYYDVKPSAYGCESQACNCVPSSGCPDDCINRLVYSECTSQLCPCRELCKNQRIQKHDWSPGLEKFMTQSKGWGVRTKLPIKSGEFILEYVGEVVSDKEFKERMAWRYARDTHHYCLHLDGGLVIDGHRMGGDGRFVNHSCLPNCEMQKWSANGTFRMALFALRDIRGGEELTYDYNFSLFNPAEGQPCKCESNNCRGVIGGKSQRVPVKPSSLKSQPKAPAVSQIATSTSNATGVWSPSPNRVGRPRKAVQAKKADGRDARAANLCEIKKHVVKYQQQLSRLYQEPQMKPLTAREKTIARDTHCFLLKNLNKVRRIRDRASTNPRLSGIGNVNGVGSSLPGNVATSTQVEKPSEKPSRPSSRKPRSARKASAAAPADDRSRRLTAALKDIYDAVVAPNDEKSASLCKPLLLRQVPERDSSVLKCPPNLVSIRAVIAGGHYSAVSHFDTDMNALFSDVVRTDGRLSAMGLAALHLKKIYNAVKPKFAERLTEIIGPDEILPAGFAPKKKQEEVIMCICGLHLEEGLMVQCAEERDKEGREREREGEREGPKGGCGVWQHAHCMGVTDTQRPFLCHRCQPREVNLEIPLDEYAEEGHRFYLSLMRGDLQVRQGDTVYVLRDIPIDEKRPDVSKRTNADTHTSSGSGRRSDAKKRPPHNKDASKETSAKNKGAKSDKKIATKETDTSKKEESAENIPKHTYKTIGDIAVSELDIFRVERLWKHKDTGERFVYGHHYLRPHETYHEPTRKFFPNEVMRVPLYEAVPIDLVMSQCWVLDVNTYCKGRPVGAVEEHVYISELRVDRGARLFTKISRPKYPVCTKSYAFDTFPQRLKISRTYAPHEVSPEFLKGRGRVADKDKPKKEKENKSRAPESDAGKTTRREPDRHPAVRILPSPQMLSQNRDMQKSRLNGILLRLLGRLPTKRPLDVSYLLDGRRQRKKMQSS